MIKTLGLPIDIDEYDAWAKAILNGLARYSVYMPGAKRLVHFLSEKEVGLGIATSCDTERIPASWESDPDDLTLFNVVVAGDDPDVELGKPNPDMLQVAAKRLEVNCHQCVYVGDNPVDEEAAKAAGMKFVAVPNYLRTADDFPHADHVIQSLDEFPLASLGIL